MEIQNFGKNIKFSPKIFYQPKTEAEILDILNQHKNGQVRAQGSLHAWNPGTVSNDAYLDIYQLNNIELIQNGSETIVNVGGGCKLKDLIAYLDKLGLALPAMGGIMQQSVAGLASTATHGTGRSSFSHYIKQIRIASYDTNGNAKIFEFTNGDELFAARTAVGCMGIVVSMQIVCLPRFWLQEKMQLIKTLDEVIANEKEWPLQQTTVIPHLWQFVPFQKKVVTEPSTLEKIRSTILRWLDYVTIEILPHVILKGLLMSKNRNANVINYYKNILPKVLLDRTVTNQDYLALTLHTRRHYTFTHVEMELFIPEPNFKRAFNAIKEITDWFAGTSEELNPDLKQRLMQVGLLDEVLAAKNSFILHYTPFIRKVLPDNTLISMTAGNLAYYAMGFFTYDPEEKRQGYYRYCKTLAKIMAALFDARPHWGKYFPLEHKDIARLYPEMEKFKTICKKYDPNRVFQNEFTRKIFG